MTEREFRKTELYNNFCKPQDIFDALYAVSDTVEDHNYSVTIQRKESRGEFDKSDRSLTQKLMPHLVRSMRVGSTIRNQNFEKNLLVDTIDSAVGALMLVDRNCRVVYVNDNALHLMTNRRDLFLKQKIFQLLDPDAGRELQSIVKKACQCGIGKVGGTLSTLRKFDTNNLVLKVIPINQSVANYGNIARECALITISRMGDYENITPKQLQRTYGLTFAEARLASNLSNGMSIDEFQDRYHVTRNTIKTQLRSCYQKTKTTGQVSLIRLILGQV
jgi:DNA-binding CsgD family transcriptional regulator